MTSRTSPECATTARIELTRASDDEIVARVRPDRADPVFAGHYPGFPLLPGVHIVEYVHRAVLAAAPTVVLAELVYCRFLRAIDLDDELVIKVRRDGELCHGTVTVSDAPAAEVVLRYRNGGD
ncbi:hypothetical protein ACLQ2S_21120 [Micromonospora sp. DT48]|uniref:hypothetical protein n=1 Tax=unclassified Micromonospora TaxID=2617518 RepID=UPI0012BB5C9C|nr:hypothetical protein [Micromonospora sp. CP22]MTK04792.1 hypothetical protein [Micromonospora sp. CP22]